MRITEYLIRTGNAKESEREVLDFGFEMLCTVLISGIVVFVTGIYMGMFAETLVLFVCSLFLIKYARFSWKIQIIFCVVGALTIAIYAPVDHESNPLDSEIKEKFGRRARAVMGDLKNKRTGKRRDGEDCI